MNTEERLLPKWDKWSKMIDATDFQLIALSLNLKPPSALKYIAPYKHAFPCYEDRLSIFHNHLMNKQLHCDQRRCDSTNEIEIYVQLDAFVKWAVDVMAWDLPHELLIIKNASTPAAPSPNLIQENELLKQQLNDAQAKIEVLEKQMPMDDERSETTYLKIIGSLVHLMLAKSPSGVKQSVYNSQTAIIEAILAHYPNAYGLKQRTLEEKFSAANKQLPAPQLR
ncbi:MAG: hypothetical protein IPI79_07270 [Moraxellaceae bacterium]|nr:hypothetical protein [Moraxellaceae bacterium]